MKFLCIVSSHLLLLLSQSCRAEVRDIEINLLPSDEKIHYTDGYIRGPGTISLSKLIFTAVSEAYEPINDDEVMDDDGGDDGARLLEGGVETDRSALDIAVFQLPNTCASSRTGCDWTELGVGAREDEKTIRWCCNSDAIQKGLCEDSTATRDRLIINGDTFSGEHRYINIPPTGPMNKQIHYGELHVENSGRYVAVFANCHAYGREIRVHGSTAWKSKHGYLPGQLFEFMYFYMGVTVVYFMLLATYCYLMHKNEESRIPIEKWVLMAILLGCLEMFFRTGDYLVWNEDGKRHNFIMYIGIALGVTKQGLSRALIVMVSLGWGVIRDNLGSALRTIIILCAMYTGVTLARELMLVFAVEDMESLSYQEEVELFDVVTVLTFIVAAVDVVFILWILDALNGTMDYLENNNQVRKLDRYLKLRSVFLFSILFASIWVIFSLVNTYDEDGIVREEHEWVVQAASEANYLYVLAGVAFLWRPNPSAKEYAYVMELPGMNTAEDGNELELTGAVPSAMDDSDDDEDDIVKTGFHDDPEDDGYDTRFQIDNATAT